MFIRQRRQYARMRARAVNARRLPAKLLGLVTRGASRTYSDSRSQRLDQLVRQASGEVETARAVSIKLNSSETKYA